MFPDNKRVDKASQSRQIVLLSISLGVLYWIMDSLVDSFIFNEGTFTTLLFHPPLPEICMRLFTMGILVFFGIFTNHIISKYKQTGDSLRESEKRYRTLAEAAQDMIYIVDRNDVVQYVNSIAAKQFECKPEELIGRKRGELFPAEVSSRQRQFLQKVFETGEALYTEDRIVFPNKELWIGASLVPFKDDTGKVSAVMGVSRDITEGKRIEKTLQESEERYRLLFHRSPVGIFNYDRELRITECNDRFTDILQSNREKLIGLDMNILKDRSVLPAIQMVTEGKEGYYEGIYHATTSAVEIWISMRTAPLFDQKGNIKGGVGIVEDITEQKKAEETLRKSEENLKLYQTLINQSNDSIEVLDPETGNFLNVNKKTCADLGYSREELLSMKVFDIDPIVKPSDFPKIIEDLRRTGGSIWSGVHLRKDGTTFPVEVSLKLVQLDRGYLVAVARDVTERKKAENALKESEERYRSLFENANDLIQSVAPDGHLLYVNPAWLKTTGYTLEELQTLTIFDILHPDHKAQCSETFKKVMSGESLDNIKAAFVAKDGRLIKVEGNANVRLVDGRAVACDGIFRDVTEHKKMEEKLFQITHDWEDTFNSITDMVTVHDKDFNIIHANKAAEKILKLPMLDISPQKCYRFYHGTDRPPEGCPSCDCLNTGLPSTTELYEPHLEMFIEITAIPRFDSSNNIAGLIHVVRDITERKKLEDQLRQSQKMEAIGQLAGGVAHDFNNILTAIIGYANILKLKLKDDPVKINIDQILVSSEKGALLTQSLLAFSRQQVSSPEPVDINDIIKNMEKLLLRVIGENIELKTELTGDLIVMADSIQIDQILINLCTNARDAMPHGGRLIIETRKAGPSAVAFLKEERSLLKLTGKDADYSGEFAELSVSDSGIGMTEKIRERIFEPFFTTKEFGKGTGLGLSIVYGIIKQHNGYIVCESEPGKGTTFKIYLPIIKAEVVRTEPEEIPDAASTAYIVLLAEDEFIVRKLTKQVLEEFGYKVIEAVDGEDAVLKFNENKDNIDLLLFDIIMPKMSGQEAYDRIMKITPGIKIILTSGYPADFINKDEIIKEGINFMAKPISPARLLKKVREVLTT
jgi:PAS domain S-box-containing protein